MSCKSGSAFPSAFEFAVRKQDRLPLVRVIDYAYQAPIDSILGGPLFASPEREIKQEEESVILTLVEESINLVYPQVPLFPHVEDYLWPDFSDDADAFFEQFEELEVLPSYRSVSLRLPPVDLHAHKRMRSQKEQIFPVYLTMQILRHHRDK